MSACALTIKKCTFAQLMQTDGFDNLVKRYIDAAKIDEAPTPSINPDFYKSLEEKGVFQFFVAEKDNKIIGGISVLLSRVPHSLEHTMGISESFYVHEEYRKTGAGLKLLCAAEEFSKSKGASVFYLTLPKQNKLEPVFDRLGYKNVQSVFAKKI